MEAQLSLFDPPRLEQAYARARLHDERLRHVAALPPRLRAPAMLVLAREEGFTRAVRVALLRRAAHDAHRDGALPARFFALLGDAEHHERNPRAARRHYLHALLVDPWGFRIDSVRDEEVRGLPDVARSEMGIAAAVPWAAAVGVVIGVLPARSGGRLPPTTNPEVGDARAFIDALVTARSGGDGTVAARRRMKQLAPGLFAAYMESLSDRGA
jgi:hypothetical protein